jgi:hypothetical protein
MKVAARGLGSFFAGLCAFIMMICAALFASPKRAVGTPVDPGEASGVKGAQCCKAGAQVPYCTSTVCPSNKGYFNCIVYSSGPSSSKCASTASGSGYAPTTPRCPCGPNASGQQIVGDGCTGG